jgi:hypothetical protein
MSQAISTLDRLRIERAVWSLDSRLQDISWRSRVAKRRELRANLLDASADVGTAEALRRVGSIPRLAAEYLSVEYGHWTRRPHWLAMVAWLLLGYVALTLLLDATSSAFIDGVLAVNPHMSAPVVWSGISHVLAPVTVTFAAGGVTSRLGGAWEPLVYAVYLMGALLVGRVWRAWPSWRTRQQDSFGD